MPGTQTRTLQRGRDSQKKLISAVLSAWETTTASARSLAAATGLPIASIYHHFGGLEHLFEAAQEDAKHSAERWCEQQLEAIRGDVKGPEALGTLLAALVDDWCETQRTLAFAWRQSQLTALRDVRHCASRAQWSAIWQSFWREICTRLDLADIAPATASLFEGLAALHLLRWRRALDRAALDELCMGWSAWLDGRLAGSSPWFDLARREALSLAEVQQTAWTDPAVASLAAAAARTVERRGVEGVTHRAVAAEAGVTLGVVSYKFRTSADLLNAAFEAIYSRIVLQSGGIDMLSELDREQAIALLEAGYAAREHVLGLEELVVAASRNAAFINFGAQLRYLRGRSSGRHLQMILGHARPIRPIDGAIFSAFMAGRGNAWLHEDRPLTRADVMPLIVRLDRGRTTDR